MNHVRRSISATAREHFGPLAGRSRCMRDWKQGSALGNSAKCMEKVGSYCCKETIDNGLVELVFSSRYHLKKPESHRATCVCSSMPSLVTLSDLHAQLGMNS